MILNFIHSLSVKFDVFTDKLAFHPEVGLYGMLQLIILNFITPSQTYEASNMHYFVLVLKDIGMLAGALLTILTLYVYITKNLLKKKQNDNKE